MRRQLATSILLGFLVAFITGIVVLELNKIFFPEYTELWRLVAWTLAFGLLFSWGFHDILDKLVAKGGKTT